MKLESFEDFIKNKCPAYNISGGSQFEAKLFLAYEEMKEIFKQELYRATYKLEQDNKLMIEFIKECSASHNETRCLYNAKAILSKLGEL